MRPNTPTDIWARAERGDGCWPWRGRLNSNGYAAVRISGRRTYAHRVAWELAHGRAVPDGLTIDHLCRNRACMNPDHMEVVTGRVNTLRGEAPSAVNARKPRCRWGHEFERMPWDPTRRFCRRCHRLDVAMWHARRRAGPPPVTRLAYPA